MKLLVINGVNLNLLGTREVEIYGKKTYKELKKMVKKYAKSKKLKVKFYISNIEGKIVNRIQKAQGKFQGIVINPGAYSHYSIAILDALKAINIPYVEVHISDVKNREEFRQNMVTAQAAQRVVSGQGLTGYLAAIDELSR